MRKLPVAALVLVACDCARPPPGQDGGLDTRPPTIEIAAVIPLVARIGTAIAIRVFIDEPIREMSAAVGGRSAGCLGEAGIYNCSYQVQGDEGEGDKPIAVRATDRAGNEGTGTAVVRYDFTAPVVTFTQGPPTATRDTAVQFDFTVSEPATTRCQVDANPDAVCASPAGTTLTADGKHTFTVMATDAAGNVGSAVREWILDRQAPDTTITQSPGATTNAADLTFAFTATEAGARFECSLDAAAHAPCSSPHTDFAASEAPHDFSVRAVDAAGNADPSPATARVVVDRTAPDTAITVAPPPATRQTGASFEFTASETGATFECALDGAAFAACSTPRIYAGLADGPHTLAVRAVDAALNADPTPAAHAWTVDTQPPDTAITVGPTGTSLNASESFEFNCTEPSCTFECRVDGASFSACTSPTPVTVTRDGSHTFEVRAQDRADNVDPTPASRTWTTDAFPPVVTITQAPANPTNLSDANFAFTANKSGVTFECQLDLAAYAACTPPAAYPGLADGTHTFRVRGTARALVGSPATHTWLIDTAKPVVSFTAAPPALANSAAARFDFISSKSPSTFECSLDGAAFAACTSPQNLSGLPEASHVFQVRAIDAVGNVGTATTHTWTVDLTPPPAPAIVALDPSRFANTTPTLLWNASAGAATYALEIAQAFDFSALVRNRTALTGLFDVVNPALDSGRYTFRVRARDAAGNDSPYSSTGVFEIRTWTFAAPRPTGTPLLSVRCRTATLCLVGGQAATLLRTSDGGANFAAQSTGADPNAIAWLDATTAVAVGPAGAIRRTTDAGVTWLPVTSGTTSDLYGAAFADASTGFAVGAGGTVLKTIDGGRAWTAQSSTVTVHLRSVAAASTAIAAAVGDAFTLVRTVNGGATWGPVNLSPPATPPRLTAIQFSSAQIGYLVGGNGTLKRTADAGQSWTDVTSATTTQLNGLHFVDDMTGVVVGNGGLVRRTTAGGASWATIGTGGTVNLHAVHFGSATAGLFVGDGGLLWRTTDAGQTLSAVTAEPAASSASLNHEIRAVHFPTAAVGYAVGQEGWAKKTPDGGKTWTALAGFTSTNHLYAVHFLDGQTGFVGGDNSLLRKTADSGATWTTPATPPSGFFRALHFADASTGYVAGTSNAVYKTTDAGATWTSIAPTVVTTSWRAVRFATPTTGWIVGDAGRIAYTTVGGATWASQNSLVSTDLRGVATLGSGTAVAVGFSGRILRTSDAGQTWVTQTSGTTVNLFAVGFTDASNGWAVGTGGTILRTADGGVTWQRQSSPTGLTLQAVVPISASQVVTAGFLRGILVTDVGGR